MKGNIQQENVSDYGLTVEGIVVETGTPIKMSFSEIPRECLSILFKTADAQFDLNAASLNLDAIAEISKLAETFSSNPGDELEILLDGGDTLNIDMSGNHIRFIDGSDGGEIIFWSCAEFEDEEEVSNVMGALAGGLIARDDFYP